MLSTKLFLCFLSGSLCVRSHRVGNTVIRSYSKSILWFIMNDDHQLSDHYCQVGGGSSNAKQSLHVHCQRCCKAMHGSAQHSSSPVICTPTTIPKPSTVRNNMDRSKNILTRFSMPVKNSFFPFITQIMQPTLAFPSWTKEVHEKAIKLRLSFASHSPIQSRAPGAFTGEWHQQQWFGLEG